MNEGTFTGAKVNSHLRTDGSGSARVPRIGRVHAKKTLMSK